MSAPSAAFCNRCGFRVALCADRCNPDPDKALIAKLRFKLRSLKALRSHVTPRVGSALDLRTRGQVEFIEMLLDCGVVELATQRDLLLIDLANIEPTSNAAVAVRGQIDLCDTLLEGK